MGNETSTEEGAQFLSPDEHGKLEKDPLGLLPLEQATSNHVGNDEENPTIIPPETAGKEDADIHDAQKGSLRENRKISDTDDTGKDVTLDELDNSRNTTTSEARASPLTLSPIPVSPLADAKDDVTLNPSRKVKKLVLVAAPKNFSQEGDSRRENDQKSDSHALQPPAAVTKIETADKLILLKAPRQSKRKDDRRHENSQESESNDLPAVVTKTDATKPKTSPEKKNCRNQSQIFSEGVLRGTLEKSNQHNICRDPLLQAVAKGSAVRKTKQEEKIRSTRVFCNNNEWKMSLRRLAKTAASTAKTVAHATAPVITDASQVVLSSATDFAQDVKKEWEKEHKQAPETEIILSPMNTSQFSSDYFDAIDGSGPSMSLDFDNIDEETSERISIEKKEMDDQGQMDAVDGDNDSPSPRKCIYEELQDMERNFDAQIKSVLSSQSFNSNDDIDHDNTDVDLSERSTEITFVEKSDSSDKPIIKSKSSEEQTLESSEKNENVFEQEPNIEDESKIGNRNQSNLDGSYCGPLQDKDIDVPSTPQMITRSGRVVKPVRRLVDGYESSVWEENEYRSNNQQTNNDEGIPTLTGESRNSSPNTNNSLLTAEFQNCSKSDERNSKTGENRIDWNDSLPPALPNDEDSNIDEIGTNTNASHPPANEEDSEIRAIGININNTPSRSKGSNISEIGTNTRDTSPHPPANNQIDNPYEIVETFASPAGTNDSLRSKIYSSSRDVKIKTSHLFGTNEDLIYQSENLNTVIGDESVYAAVELEKNVSMLHLEQETSVERSEDSFFTDRKSVVKYVVAKLTGYDIEVKDKIEKNSLFDPTSLNEYPVVKSIFEKQVHDDVEVLSSGSLSSPPEIDISFQNEDEDPRNILREEMNELLPMFEFIPAKSEIPQIETAGDENMGKPNILKENIMKRQLFKQGSIGSIKDSLGSFSTHERSSNNSVTFSSSRRSKRRRRRGSRLSLALSNTQLSNTQSTKSPYETPIENRSLLNDKQQAESNLVDHGGQLLRWDADIEARFPSVPDTEEMTEALERSELFHDTLASFSSLENIDFLKNFPFRKSTKVSKTLASLMWRQLVANWKHSESCKAMLTKPSSIQPAELTKHEEIYGVDDDLSSSVSTIQLRFDTRKLALPNYFLSPDSYSLLRCFDNGNGYDVINNGIVILTRFLCDIGPGLSSSAGDGNTANVESILRHDLSITLESDENLGTLNITEIQTEAKKLLRSLERVIGCIAKYSTQNGPTPTDIECNDITYSCGVKDYASIRNKARRKYDGDISQVKDVLRGQITFPDEGSLICGLSCLHSIAEHRSEGKKDELAQSSVAFKIIRLKNLFRTTGVTDEISNVLPTGYRHILVNIMFDCGLVAELQFQITQLFEVMGDEGYLLHQEIVSSPIKNVLHPVPSGNVRNSTKSENDLPFSISTSAFVQSILTTLTIENLQSQPRRKTLSKNGKDDNRVTSVTTSSGTQVISNNVPNGSIGGLAAQATLKKQKCLDEEAGEPTPVNLPSISIGALAAEAALKKSGDLPDKSKKSENSRFSSHTNGTTIVSLAALAAQEALKKTQYIEETSNTSDGKSGKTEILGPAIGGIAALAAQAASAKAQKTLDEEEPPNSQTGRGIAALAAQTALKESQLTSDTEESPAPPLGGGIAALAAQAALKKSEVKLEREVESPVSPAGGEITALDTQAALKKSEEKLEREVESLVLTTTVAAQAALKKSEEYLDEEEPSVFSPGGGIAALDTQAALKKAEEKIEREVESDALAVQADQAVLKKSEEKLDEEEPSVSSPGGGIAALAAQAALKKSEEKIKREVESDALAAQTDQAVLKKSEGKLDEEEPSVFSPGGGIAAVAAQTALKKSEEKLDEEEPPVSSTGGRVAALATEGSVEKSEENPPNEIQFNPPVSIAALAAEAALKKSKKALDKEEPSNPPTRGGITTEGSAEKAEENPPNEIQFNPSASIATEEILFTPPVSIAALAAEADLKKSQKNRDNEEEPPNPSTGPIGGGIAALVGKSALEKSEGNLSKDILFTPPDGSAVLATVSNDEPLEPPSGGIAALAAQADLKKSEEKSQELPPGGIAALAADAALKRSREKPDKEEPTAPLAPPLDGIATLAAEAALKRSREKLDREEPTAPLAPPSGGIATLDTEEPTAPPAPPPGGIVALAAEATLKRSQEKLDKEEPASPPPGGIAALAAQAALKKSQVKPQASPSGGIAALAAQAALKKSQEELHKEESTAPPPPGGIATLAAQAALKKSQVKPQASPFGGIAALAAQAALNKSKEKSSKENQNSPPGGIAALAAQSASKKARNKSTEVDTRQNSVGGVATLAAHDALKKIEKGVTAGDLLKPSDTSVEHHDANIDSYSMTMLMTAVLESGILDAISNPRDVPAFCCLHLLASSLQKHESSLLSSEREKEGMPSLEMSTFSRRLLLRSLSISNQAASIGMIGWLEYGSRNFIDRALILPLEVLQQLSCNMAAAKEWAKASDVLCSLWLRCEQNLPRCHPTTLCSMLDLAGALSKTNNTDSAKLIISQVLDLFTNFLSEVESLFYDRQYFELYCNDPNRRRVVFFDDCLDAVGIMKAFSKQFHKDLSRDFLELLGRKHPTSLLNQSLVADSFLVLANCLSASEEKMDNRSRNISNKGSSSRYFWSLAYSQYDLALRGWISLESIIHPNAASITFSIARCLRELGRLRQAINLLETLASCLEQKLDDEALATKKETRYSKPTVSQYVEIPSSSKGTFTPLNKENRTSSSTSSSSLKDSRPSFISRRRLGNSISRSSSKNVIKTESCEREQTAAVCFWMMAVLTAEQNPDELGRNRALSLLHTASLTLQRVLSRNGNGSSVVDEQTLQTCLDLYEQIEGEALDLFEPLERIPLVKDFEAKEEKSTNNVLPRKKRAPWEILTPMRRKREWTSPRSRINRNRAARSSGTTTISNTFFE